MKRRSWIAVALCVVSGAVVAEGCTSSDGSPLPEGDAGSFDLDGSSFIPTPDGQMAPLDAAGDSTVPSDSSRPPPADSGMPETSTENDAANDARPDTSTPADSSAPDAADAETPDAADANIADAADAEAVDAADGALADAADGALADAAAPFTHYVLRSGQGQVEAYGLNLATGALSPINQTSVGGSALYQNTNVNPIASALTPSGQYLYLSDFGTPGVGGFVVEHGGLLARIDADPVTSGIQDFPAGTGARFVVATSGFVFTANEIASSVSRFAIGAGGFLTSLGDVALPSGAQPNGIAVDPTGAFLFSFNYGLGTITVFTIDAAGSLTAVDQDPATPGQQDYTSPNADFIGVVHPTLRVLYISGASSTNEILPLSYSASGVLSPDGTEATAGVDGGTTNPTPYGLAVDPSGTHLYSVGYFSTVINIFSIDQVTGALTAAGTATADQELRAVSVDPSGSFLFTAGDSGSLTGYRITAGTGALTQILPVTSAPLSSYTVPIGIVP